MPDHRRDVRRAGTAPRRPEPLLGCPGLGGANRPTAPFSPNAAWQAVTKLFPASESPEADRISSGQCAEALRTADTSSNFGRESAAEFCDSVPWPATGHL